MAERTKWRTRSSREARAWARVSSPSLPLSRSKSHHGTARTRQTSRRGGTPQAPRRTRRRPSDSHRRTRSALTSWRAKGSESCRLYPYARPTTAGLRGCLGARAGGAGLRTSGTSMRTLSARTKSQVSLRARRGREREEKGAYGTG